MLGRVEQLRGDSRPSGHADSVGFEYTLRRVELVRSAAPAPVSAAEDPD